MDVGGSFLPPGQIQVSATRCAGTDEHSVKALVQKPLQALDPLAKAHFRTHGGDEADFFVDNFLWQAKLRDLATDHAAST